MAIASSCSSPRVRIDAMHPIVRDNLRKRTKTQADKAARMHAAGKSPRKRPKVSGKAKRAGSAAYRPGSSVCYDGSTFAAVMAAYNV